MALDPGISSLLILLALAGAVTDVRSGIIPNRLTLPAVALALLGRLAVGGGSSLIEGCFGLLLTSGGPLVVFLSTRGAGIGGGDVKLFAALGALSGPAIGMQLLVGSCLLLLLYASFALAWRGRVVSTLSQSMSILLGHVMPKRFIGGRAEPALTSLRMGPFIAVAALLVALGPRFIGIPPWLSHL